MIFPNSLGTQSLQHPTKNVSFSHLNKIINFNFLKKHVYELKVLIIYTNLKSFHQASTTVIHFGWSLSLLH